MRGIVKKAAARYPLVSPEVLNQIVHLAECRYPPAEGWSNCTLTRIHEALDKAATDLIVETEDCDLDLLFTLLEQ